MTGLISPLETIASDDPSSAPETSGDTSRPVDDLSLVRELVLRAHPDVVPELIGGDSVAAIVASISPAQAAYSDLAAKIREAGATTSAPGSGGSDTGGVPRVPAGSIIPAPLDPDRMPASEKLRRGVRERASRAVNRDAR